MRGNAMRILKRLWGRSSHEDTQTRLDAIFRKLDAILTDEAKQNAVMPEEVRALLESGPAVDELPGASGDFGRSITNPIPVNGPIGEVAYLSSLRTDDGRFLLAHRIGSRETVDIFELVTGDGRDWDILYLTLYHPRRSRKAPRGYQFRAPDSPPMIYATTVFVPDFPRQMNQAVSEWAKSMIGFPLVSPEIRKAVERRTFVRTPAHAARLSTLEVEGNTEVAPNAPAKLLREHVESMQESMVAVLERRIACDPIDSAELSYFCASIATYAYLRFGRSEPNERMLDEFSAELVKESVKRSRSFGDAVDQYRQRYKEYAALFEGLFEDGSDQGHMLVTILMHAVERMSGQTARGHMIEISLCAPVVAALFQDSIEFARNRLQAGAKA